MPHLPVRLEAQRSPLKNQWAMTLMDLHRVPSTKCDVGPALAGKMDKILLAAGPASRPWLSGCYFGAFVAPEVEGKQSAPHLLVSAHYQFDGFSRGDRTLPDSRQSSEFPRSRRFRRLREADRETRMPGMRFCPATRSK